MKTPPLDYVLKKFKVEIGDIKCNVRYRTELALFHIMSAHIDSVSRVWEQCNGDMEQFHKRLRQTDVVEIGGDSCGHTDMVVHSLIHASRVFANPEFIDDYTQSFNKD